MRRPLPPGQPACLCGRASRLLKSVFARFLRSLPGQIPPHGPGCEGRRIVRLGPSCGFRNGLRAWSTRVRLQQARPPHLPHLTAKGRRQREAAAGLARGPSSGAWACNHRRPARPPRLRTAGRSRPPASGGHAPQPIVFGQPAPPSPQTPTPPSPPSRQNLPTPNRVPTIRPTPRPAPVVAGWYAFHHGWGLRSRLVPLHPTPTPPL